MRRAGGREGNRARGAIKSSTDFLPQKYTLVSTSLCVSISGVATHFFMSCVTFLVLTTIRRVGQITKPTNTAMGNYLNGVEDIKMATAPSWRNKYYYLEMTWKCRNLQIYFWLSRYSADHYRNKANYLSNPDVKFMGKETGSWDKDNARVLSETRFRSAAVGDESTTICECLHYVSSPSVVMFCFLFDGKFQLPMGLYSSCMQYQPAGRQNMSTMLNRISRLKE